MNIYEKLQEARKIIRETKVKKEGTNEYSKYDYFTPEQVEGLVFDAAERTKTICLTSLVKDEFGYSQKLIFVNLEDVKDRIKFELRTEKPSITATNDTQQMGGMDTYSERYIKMKVFQIKDNNIDFDAQDNRPAQKAAPAKTKLDVSAYRKKLESATDLATLQKVWSSLPAVAKTELEPIKETLKQKYASSKV